LSPVKWQLALEANEIGNRLLRPNSSLAAMPILSSGGPMGVRGIDPQATPTKGLSTGLVSLPVNPVWCLKENRPFKQIDIALYF
jgi:hypothetical protein